MLERLVVSLLLTGSAGLAHGQIPAVERAPELPVCEQPPGEGQSAVVGRINDEKTGLPLQKADVVLEWEQRAGRRVKVEVETDEDGAFSACTLPAGTRITMTAKFGRADDRQQLELETGETRTLTVELDAPRSRVAGRVVEHGLNRGVSDAELRIKGSRIHSATAADGSFQLPELPPGRYLLETSHLGYGPRADTVEVEYGSIMIVTIALAPEAIPLRPIDVAVRSINLEQRGFYDRKERGFGSFLTRQDWSARAISLPSELLRRIPGVRIARHPRGFGNVVYDRSNCPFRYIVDGTPVSDSFQMDDLPAEWIEALEVFRGVAQVPVQFRAPPTSPRANCGVIVIWTRTAR
jgi:hypothetical protein